MPLSEFEMDELLVAIRNLPVEDQLESMRIAIKGEKDVPYTRAFVRWSVDVGGPYLLAKQKEKP